MRTTRMIVVLLLVAVVNWPTRSLAFVDTTASWQFGGSAVAAHKSGNPFTSSLAKHLMTRSRV